MGPLKVVSLYMNFDDDHCKKMQRSTDLSRVDQRRKATKSTVNVKLNPVHCTSSPCSSLM